MSNSIYFTSFDILIKILKAHDCRCVLYLRPYSLPLKLPCLVFGFILCDHVMKENLDSKSLEFKTWYTEEYKVRKWLICTMSPEVHKYLFMNSVKEPWYPLHKYYTRTHYDWEVYCLLGKAKMLTQGDKYMIE